MYGVDVRHDCRVTRYLTIAQAPLFLEILDAANELRTRVIFLQRKETFLAYHVSSLALNINLEHETFSSPSWNLRIAHADIFSVKNSSFAYLSRKARSGTVKVTSRLFGHQAVFIVRNPC